MTQSGSGGAWKRALSQPLLQVLTSRRRCARPPVALRRLGCGRRSVWDQRHAVPLRRQNWPIFRPRQIVNTHRVPQRDIGIYDRPTLLLQVDWRRASSSASEILVASLCSPPAPVQANLESLESIRIVETIVIVIVWWHASDARRHRVRWRGVFSRRRCRHAGRQTRHQ
jgi:hypothetical protein